jgi:hypothetical protein
VSFLALASSPDGVDGWSPPPETTDEEADADATRRCVEVRVCCRSNMEVRVGEVVRLG